ncbi:hypothetical protein BJX64DRAFT_266912 [Aspergillus heterothallicus]
MELFSVYYVAQYCQLVKNIAGPTTIGSGTLSSFQVNGLKSQIHSPSHVSTSGLPDGKPARRERFGTRSSLSISRKGQYRLDVLRLGLLLLPKRNRKSRSTTVSFSNSSCRLRPRFRRFTANISRPFLVKTCSAGITLLQDWFGESRIGILLGKLEVSELPMRYL